MTTIYSVVAALEEALSSAPDTWAESESFVNDPPVNDDVLDVDLYAMLSEGTREWDVDKVLKRLLSRPSWLINRYQDKVWRLAQLMDSRYAPDTAVNSMLTLLGFGSGHGRVVANSLDPVERRMLVRIAAKFWRLRGRHDALSTAIMFLTHAVRPRIIPWRHRATRVGDMIVGVSDMPNADLGMVVTEHFTPLSDSDAQVTLLRIMDVGTLNRTGVEAIVELARPSHEIFEIAYVSFVDTFYDGRIPYWIVDSSKVSYAKGDGKLPGMVMDPETDARVFICGCNDWGSIVYSFVAEISATASLFATINVEDSDNYWRVQISPASSVPLVEVFEDGISAHSTSPIDVSYDVPSQVGVQIDVEPTGDDTWVRVRIDGDLIGEALLADRVASGSVGILNGAGDSVRLMAVEVYENPVQRVILGPEGREMIPPPPPPPQQIQ